MGSKFLATALLLCLLNHVTDMAAAWNDQDFFKHCPTSRCSKDGPEIRFPLQLESSSTSLPCAAKTCTKFACSGQDTILFHPFLGPSRVTSIDYKQSLMTIIPSRENYSSGCPMQELTLPTNAGIGCELYFNEPGRLVSCSRKYSLPAQFKHSFDGIDEQFITGPVPCLSNTDRFTYLINVDFPMLLLPLDCMAVSDSEIPIFRTEINPLTFKQRAEDTFSFSEMTVSWSQREDDLRITDSCTKCELQGRHCAFSLQRNRTFCMPHPRNGSRAKVISATSSVTCFIVLSTVLAVVLYLSLRSKYNEEIHLKVEMFLQTYGTLKPMRYSFSEVKKIAQRFKERVGQGGFGSVYRGQLPNGLPVAVKVLENSAGEGEEFINEVATIGRIHHANIVRLLGFCSEGTRRALIYEFMPNESLGKYIFSSGLNASDGLLTPNKMLDIALGIARGMEYLHQGCNQRILHFDIKPHNILLDYNFNPKISDFGLAKLCTRDQSIVTLTAARGTMGYIAPEIYSPNFGGISYKSDVYSFGMLVLEMVSGRRNSDPCIEIQEEFYLPEWTYERVIAGQDLVIDREITEDEKKMARKLAIVALWCIQWKPQNRPSMTKVVNMLLPTGSLQDLQIPPKPYV